MNLHLAFYSDILAYVALYNVNWMMIILVIGVYVLRNNADILYAFVELFSIMFLSGK